MPNHCYQQVSIKGPSKLVRHLYAELKENSRFCDVVVPMPFELWAAPDITSNKYGFETSSPQWYDWRYDNWDTKWDVCDVDVHGDLETDGDHPFDMDCTAWFNFNCWTAWGPPLNVWNKLVALGVEVKADYQDECGQFEGMYANGKNHSWEPEDEECEDEEEA